MSRRNHAHAEEFRLPDRGTEGLALWQPPPVPAPVPVAPPAPAPRPREIREAKAERLRDARWRRWIDAGKPVALAVARTSGKVTADSFRTEAATRGVLPPKYGENRTGSYVSTMFAEMVREGTLRKRVRADGSVVKEFSDNRNEHTIYELADGAR